MSQSKVRVAVVGLGSWGTCHVEAFASLPQVEVVAVCEPREDRLEAIANQFDIVDRYTSPEALWERDDIDLVSIVTEESQHLKPTIAALSSGKHVLVEKPVSLQLDEARAMQAAAQQHNKWVLPGHILRFDMRYAEAAEAIRVGSIGDVASIYSRRARPRSQASTYSRVHPVYVTMAHDIDLSIWYAQSRVKTVRAWERRINIESQPDLLWACLEFENGTLAVLQSTWLMPDAVNIGRADSCEIIGKRGCLMIETGQSGYEQWLDGGRISPDLSLHGMRVGQVSGALRDQMRCISDCILQNRTPDYISFPDAIHGLEVAQAVIASCEAGTDVHINN